ncbi:MAG: chloride channel protein, partial [Acidobacteriaceae bacterium]
AALPCAASWRTPPKKKDRFFHLRSVAEKTHSFEDGFEHICGRLRVHWLWWPAIGGIGVGVGGLFFPRGLGVGYDNIAEVLRGNAPVALLLGLIVAKSLMWAFSLSSGTSGGVRFLTDNLADGGTEFFPINLVGHGPPFIFTYL